MLHSHRPLWWIQQAITYEHKEKKFHDLGSLKPAAILFTLKCLQESTRWSGNFSQLLLMHLHILHHIMCNNYIIITFIPKILVYIYIYHIFQHTHWCQCIYLIKAVHISHQCQWVEGKSFLTNIIWLITYCQY